MLAFAGFGVADAGLGGGEDFPHPENNMVNAAAAKKQIKFRPIIGSYLLPEKTSLRKPNHGDVPGP